ncbi:MAG: metal-dependent transcriptional regulator [Micrococcaceae bacterium]
MTDLIDTTEMYLRTIMELEEERVVPLRARISERLGHSNPTVFQNVSRMQRNGLVTLKSGDNRLLFTKEGKAKAIQVMRKHRLAEILLCEVIGLGYEEIHDEACRWEHVMSESVEKRLVKILSDITHSPYGNPIPGLQDLGLDDAYYFDNDIQLDKTTAGKYQITRLSEGIQTNQEALKLLHKNALVPSSVIEVVEQNEYGTVLAGTKSGTYNKQISAAIFVKSQK